MTVSAGATLSATFMSLWMLKGEVCRRFDIPFLVVQSLFF